MSNSQQITGSNTKLNQNDISSSVNDGSNIVFTNGNHLHASVGVGLNGAIIDGSTSAVNSGSGSPQIGGSINGQNQNSADHSVTGSLSGNTYDTSQNTGNSTVLDGETFGKVWSEI